MSCWLMSESNGCSIISNNLLFVSETNTQKPPTTHNSYSSICSDKGVMFLKHQLSKSFTVVIWPLWSWTHLIKPNFTCFTLPLIRHCTVVSLETRRLRHRGGLDLKYVVWFSNKMGMSYDNGRVYIILWILF